MNENLDLCKILKDVPAGTKFWSSAIGDCELSLVDKKSFSVISKKGGIWRFESDGLLGGADNSAEIAIFPSKDERDWSKFEVPKQKVKVTLHPFDRVLVRDRNDNKWQASIFSNYDTGWSYVCIFAAWKQCIPYNEDTAPLLGTSDPCPIDYEIEFSKDYKPAQQ